MHQDSSTNSTLKLFYQLNCVTPIKQDFQQWCGTNNNNVSRHVIEVTCIRQCSKLCYGYVYIRQIILLATQQADLVTRLSVGVDTNALQNAVLATFWHAALIDTTVDHNVAVSSWSLTYTVLINVLPCCELFAFWFTPSATVIPSPTLNSALKNGRNATRIWQTMNSNNTYNTVKFFVTSHHQRRKYLAQWLTRGHHTQVSLHFWDTSA